jgi:hypothetical protein
VLTPPHWIEDVRWSDAKASVNLTQQDVKNSPPYKPSVQVDSKMEIYIFHHYILLANWMD